MGAMNCDHRPIVVELQIHGVNFGHGPGGLAMCHDSALR